MGKKLVQRLAIKKLLNDDIFGDTILNKYKTNRLAKQILDGVWGFLCNPHNSRGSLPALSALNPVELGRIAVLYNKHILRLAAKPEQSSTPALLSPTNFIWPDSKARSLIVIRKALYHWYKVLRGYNRRYVMRKRYRMSSASERRRIRAQVRYMRINKIKARPPRPTYHGRRWIGEKIYRKGVFYVGSFLISNRKRTLNPHVTTNPAYQIISYYKFWDSLAYFSKTSFARLQKRGVAPRRGARKPMSLVLRFSDRQGFRKKFLKGPSLDIVLQKRLAIYFGFSLTNNAPALNLRGVYSILKKSNRPYFSSIELRLLNIILRAGFVDNPYTLNQLIQRSLFTINGLAVNDANNAEIQVWDIVRPNFTARWLVYSTLLKKLYFSKSKNSYSYRNLFRKRLKSRLIRKTFKRAGSRLSKVEYLKNALRPKNLYFPLVNSPNYMEISFVLLSILIVRDVYSGEINVPFSLRDLKSYSSEAQLAPLSLWAE